MLPKLKPGKIRKIIEMGKSGHSSTEISKKLHIAGSTVFRYLREGRMANRKPSQAPAAQSKQINFCPSCGDRIPNAYIGGGAQ